MKEWFEWADSGYRSDQAILASRFKEPEEKHFVAEKIKALVSFAMEFVSLQPCGRW
jgi:hypothetical protein